MMIWVIIAAIAVLLFLIVKKVHPMLALLLVTVFSGMALGMPALKIIGAIQNGVGSTMGSVAFVIVLGAILGKWMEVSGAAHTIAQTLVAKFGKGNIQWAILLTSFLVGIPMFYNAGFVVLVPLVFALAAETGLSLLFLGLPMAAALSVTHGLLPPHPSPVALASIFKANVGTTLLYGLIICIPTAVLAGPLLGKRFKHIITHPPAGLFDVSEKPKTINTSLAFVMALLPVLLILLSVVFTNLSTTPAFQIAFQFIGDPLISFLISVVVVLLMLLQTKQHSIQSLMDHAVQATAGIAVIIMIIAAGGAFKQVLIDSGVGDAVKSAADSLSLSPLLLGWLIAALIRITLGSATVAGLTAAGIVAPIVAASNVSPELMVLAVGSGSLMFSHVNDTGFWMFKEYFNLTIKQTFLSWTLMETIVSVLGLAGVLSINYFIS